MIASSHVIPSPTGRASGGIAWLYAACGCPPARALYVVCGYPPRRENIKGRRHLLLPARHKHQFTDALDTPRFISLYHFPSEDSAYLIFLCVALATLVLDACALLLLRYLPVDIAPRSLHSLSLRARYIANNVYGSPLLGLIIDHSILPIRVGSCDPHASLSSSNLRTGLGSQSESREVAKANMSQLSKCDIYHP